jgi:hypothetical protein
LYESVLPPELSLRVSEGYAYYGLHPAAYGESAARFAKHHSPARAICIGIRSIGTSLSAIVAAELGQHGVEVDLYSVRPHGHPFHRTLALRDDLAAVLSGECDGAYFLIVDEGPGLSGSSFASVAGALSALGIDDSRIVLFPSWDADGATFRSEAARGAWMRHERYPAVRKAAVSGIEWSAGAWRRHVLGDDETGWPAVQPQHEVEKWWQPAERVITRFAGFGRYGRAKLARAEALAAEHLGAPPVNLREGFLSLAFVPGRSGPPVSEALCDAIAAHLAFLSRRFLDDRSPSIDQLELMIATNTGSGIGARLGPDALADARAALAAAPAARIDGRMMRHEWIESPDGHLMKVDALDHHADHFFPGVQDAGWDLAAAVFEFRMTAAQRDRLVARYVALSGDRDVLRRLPFYGVAYPAFRLGYASLACESVGSDSERARFAQVAARCRDRLMSPSAP